MTNTRLLSIAKIVEKEDMTMTAILKKDIEALINAFYQYFGLDIVIGVIGLTTLAVMAWFIK